MTARKAASVLQKGDRISVLAEDANARPVERVVERVEEAPYGMVRIVTQRVDGYVGSVLAADDFLFDVAPRRLVALIAGLSPEQLALLEAVAAEEGLTIESRDEEAES